MPPDWKPCQLMGTHSRKGFGVLQILETLVACSIKGVIGTIHKVI